MTRTTRSSRRVKPCDDLREGLRCRAGRRKTESGARVKDAGIRTEARESVPETDLYELGNKHTALHHAAPGRFRTQERKVKSYLHARENRSKQNH